MYKKGMLKGTLKIAAYDEWYGPLYDCPYCGENYIWDNFKFCPMCGGSLEGFLFEEFNRWGENRWGEI